MLKCTSMVHLMRVNFLGKCGVLVSNTRNIKDHQFSACLTSAVSPLSTTFLMGMGTLLSSQIAS